MPAPASAVASPPPALRTPKKGVPEALAVRPAAGPRVATTAAQLAAAAIATDRKRGMDGFSRRPRGWTPSVARPSHSPRPLEIRGFASPPRGGFAVCREPTGRIVDPMTARLPRCGGDTTSVPGGRHRASGGRDTEALGAEVRERAAGRGGGAG